MSLIYLDYNCFQRNFDDLSKVKIKMEAIACQWIFAQAEKENIRLVWSFMHEDENVLSPFFLIERLKCFVYQNSVKLR